MKFYLNFLIKLNQEILFFLLALDLLKNSFSIKNQYFKIARNEVIKSLNNNSFAKKYICNTLLIKVLNFSFIELFYFLRDQKCLCL